MGLFYLLVASMPLERSPLLEHFFGSISVIKYLGFTCLVLALILPRRKKPWAGLRQPASVYFIALACWSLLSEAFVGSPSPWSHSPGASYLSFLALLPTVLILVTTERRLRATLWAMAGGMGLAALYVLREWQNHLGTAHFRPGWIAGDPNYFTIGAVLVLPLIWNLRRENRHPALRWLLTAGMLLLIVATWLAASRGGLLGLIAGALWLVWRAQRAQPASRRRGLTFGNLQVWKYAPAGLLILPLLLALPNSPLQRLLHPSRSDRMAVMKREVVWRAGLRMVIAHPLWGVGLGNFKNQVAAYEKAPHKDAWRSNGSVRSLAHNTYLEIAAELGLPGLLAWGLLWLATWRSLERSRKQAPSGSLVRITAEALEAGLLGYAVSMFFLSAEYQKLLWLALFLALALPPLAAREAERTRLQPA